MKITLQHCPKQAILQKKTHFPMDFANFGSDWVGPFRLQSRFDPAPDRIILHGIHIFPKDFADAFCKQRSDWVGPFWLQLYRRSGPIESFCKKYTQNQCILQISCFFCWAISAPNSLAERHERAKVNKHDVLKAGWGIKKVICFIESVQSRFSKMCFWRLRETLFWKNAVWK